MSQERGEGEIPYCERDASRAGLLEMRPFGEAKSISGHQTLQLMRRTGEACTLTGQTQTRERIPHRQGDRRRPSRGTSRPTGNTGETREGNPIGSQRIHSTCSLPDFIFKFFNAGVRDLFSATEKKRSRFDSAQPNDTSNTNDLCLECISALESYTGNNERGLTRGFPFITSFTTREPRPHQSKWRNAPPESKGELLHLSPRDTIRYLNRLKESEEAATLPAQPTGKPLISPISRPKKEI
ncbi:LOW QUALITY PROTEIN: putative mitochondrial protein [Cinnamomum micranthum f. kanehirae]|uniref:Putative mitochondrial protein n=1 Tax=Cinnamomum micranthum f. kanehirae TaxID=337451 RepID=A0A3S3NMP3_9MAGN|nr:LOW QUALITY PROTEIN: putative mitochondrial protein [Cinnamomum micranthum f. kanehirae]